MMLQGVVVFPGLNVDYTDEFTESADPSPPLPVPLIEELMKADNRWFHQLQNNIVELTNHQQRPADEVSPGIWLGDYSDANNPDFLRANKIGVVLNLAGELDDHHVVPGVQLVKVGMADGATANPGLFDKAADVIANAIAAKSPILVHCAAGISRSTTAVITYLMQHKGKGWRAALKAIKAKRPIVNPHPKLMQTVMRDLGKSFKV
jgi:protein-tyrosine phosphatase